MFSGGAYSKKYQQLERERVQNMRDQEKKATRDRALLLSKQTAQRQKALEEKKRAMAIAEEQRRRKALEERRKAQHEATARFKSAICRIKSNPKAAKHKPLDDVEIYLPDKARPKAKNSTDGLSGQLNMNAHGVSERVALGRDVKIKNGNGGHVGLQRRTPSLDDVLNQIRGGVDRPALPNGHPPPLTHSHGRITVHRPPAVSIPSSTRQQQAAMTSEGREKGSVFLLRGRSASDSNLNTLATRTARAQQTSSDRSGQRKSDLEHSKLKVEEVELSVNGSDELMVFKPVLNVGGARQYATPTSRMVQCDDSTRVLSPEPANSSTSSSERSLSPPLNDSLDQPAVRYAVTSVAKHLRASRQQNEQAARRRLLSPQTRPGSGDSSKNGQHSSLKVMGIPAAAHPPSLAPTTPPSSQPIYVCRGSDSDDHDTDSLNEVGSYSAQHLSKKQHQHVDNPSNGGENSVVTQPSKTETEAQHSSKTEAEPKPSIVGILKKTSSFGADLYQMDSSTRTLHTERSRSCSSRASNVSSTSKTQKKVRFFIDKSDSEPSRDSHAPHSGGAWSRVLPNSSHHVPNSAFTPKMRVSLSKASTVPPAAPSKRTISPSPLNGITVHVPVAPEESPSPQHTPQHSLKDEGMAQKQAQKSNGTERNSEHERIPPTSVADGLPPTAVREEPSIAIDPPSSSKSLDKTPTDGEINDMWEQIRTCLEDGKQPGTLSPQVYPFQNGVQRYTTSTTTYERETDNSSLSSAPPTRGHQQASTGKASEQGSVKLIHRQNSRSRPMRCHHHPNSATRRQQNHFHHGHSATYPYSNQEQSIERSQHRVHPPGVQMSSREPELMVRTMTSNSNGRITPTSLSLEEQRLIQSIEKLNQRLKDHLARPPELTFKPPPSEHYFTSDYYPHPPREPQPINSRSRGHADLLKHNRTVNWHPRTTPPTTSNSSRANHRTKSQHDLYDT